MTDYAGVNISSLLERKWLRLHLTPQLPPALVTKDF